MTAPQTLSRFRPTYRTLSEHEQGFLATIKSRADQLDRVIEEAKLLTLADKRALALATTKLEEAVMWAVKGVTA